MKSAKDSEFKKYFGRHKNANLKEHNRGIQRFVHIIVFIILSSILFATILKGDIILIIITFAFLLMISSIIVIDIIYFKNPNNKNIIIQLLIKIINKKTFKEIKDRKLTWIDELKHQRLMIFFMIMIILPTILFVIDFTDGYYFNYLDSEYNTNNDSIHTYVVKGELHFSKTTTQLSDDFLKSIFEIDNKYNRFNLCFDNIIYSNSTIKIFFNGINTTTPNCFNITNQDIDVPFRYEEKSNKFDNTYEYKIKYFIRKNIKRDMKSQIFSVSRSIICWWVVMLLIWTIFEKMLYYHRKDPYFK